MARSCDALYVCVLQIKYSQSSWRDIKLEHNIKDMGIKSHIIRKNRN